MTSRSRSRRPSTPISEVTFRLGCTVCEGEFFAYLGGDLLEAAEHGGPIYTDCPRCEHQRKCRVVAPRPDEIGGERP